MQTDMQTPRVLITGGTSGLGLALVRELRARGASVAFVARTAERVAAVAREHGAHGVVGDVAQKHDIHRIALQALGTSSTTLPISVRHHLRCLATRSVKTSSVRW
jgi:NAD(P)-dependent dehydrogenase (short-subunit alcohol dehydrogenase family)